MLIRTPADLGALIRERRIALKLDQEALAKAVGTSRKWIVEVEAGKPRAAVGLILRALRSLGVTLQVNTSGQPERRPKSSPSFPQVDLDAHLESFKRRND